MSNRTRKTVIAVAATAAATIATGGLACICSGNCCNNSGGTAGLMPALTSASLAALGAVDTADGLGMAGGTAIIAGVRCWALRDRELLPYQIAVSTSKEYTLMVPNCLHL